MFLPAHSSRIVTQRDDDDADADDDDDGDDDDDSTDSMHDGCSCPRIVRA